MMLTAAAAAAAAPGAPWFGTVAVGEVGEERSQVSTLVSPREPKCSCPSLYSPLEVVHTTVPMWRNKQKLQQQWQKQRELC